jgi:hypothetical protein
MEKYKIRITSKPGTFLEHDLILASDFVAVRHGQRMVADGETLEVFRNGECIFMSEDLGPVYAPMSPLKMASMN